MVRIPQPSALPGDEVSAENYRMRPAMWEHGECTAAEFNARRDGGGRWQYTVILHRRGPSDTCLRLYVGDGQIERDT